jgi:hypothetical protein
VSALPSQTHAPCSASYFTICRTSGSNISKSKILKRWKKKSAEFAQKKSSKKLELAALLRSKALYQQRSPQARRQKRRKRRRNSRRNQMKRKILAKVHPVEKIQRSKRYSKNYNDRHKQHFFIEKEDQNEKRFRKWRKAKEEEQKEDRF